MQFIFTINREEKIFVEKAKKTAKFLKEHGFKTGDLVCVTVRKLQCTDETIRKALIDQGLTL